MFNYLNALSVTQNFFTQCYNAASHLMNCAVPAILAANVTRIANQTFNNTFNSQNATFLLSNVSHIAQNATQAVNSTIVDSVGATAQSLVQSAQSLKSDDMVTMAGICTALFYILKAIR